MQNVYIFLKRASTRFRFYEKLQKKRRELRPGLGEAIIIFFKNTYLVGPFYKNSMRYILVYNSIFWG